MFHLIEDFGCVYSIKVTASEKLHCALPNMSQHLHYIKFLQESRVERKPLRKYYVKR
jgi:hypothetical protein